MENHVTKKIAVTCLIFQFFGVFSTLLPVSVAFSKTSHTIFSSRTATYTLASGETIPTVANRFGLSVDELKKFNEFRTYSKPFEQLSVGDDVDVPLTPLPPQIDIAQSNVLANDAEKDLLTNSMSTLGTVFASGDTGQQVSSMATGAASSAASAAMENWLGQFGTAQVQLNVDDEFDLDSSSVDVLVPLYDKQEYLILTQWGLRYKDDRTTWNIGAGTRTFQGNWMYGVNSFYDYDLTGDNKRWGVGGEVWTNYLKLAANGYFGITDWHQSRDFADYNERPADGYDLRMDAYLPVYPQLGAKLMYEQYKGEKVALFGKDNLQADPAAVTLGFNYTPIPLVTIGFDHKQGQDGDHDTQLQLEVNFKLGVPWAQQINSDVVSDMRTLAGSRYDLVERNNNIVLEYQKQELIKLALPELITGKQGDTTILTAQVTSKYGVDHVTWDVKDLQAAGGAATETSKTTLAITYPPYQSGLDAALNAYNVSAVAYDSQGNKSNSATTKVQVQPSEATILTGNLVVTQDNAQADGKATNAVQAKVTDASGNVLVNQQVTFTANNGAVVTTLIGTTGADGLATAILTNTTTGVTQVTAALANGMTQSVDTNFGSGASILVGNLIVTQDNAQADGKSTNAVQAKVTDASGNVLVNQQVTFTANNGAVVTTLIGTTGADGLATAILTNTTTGVTQVTAALANGMTQSVDTNFGTSAIILTGNLTVTQNNAIADGNAVNAVQAKITDSSGNALANQKVSFTASNSAVVTTAIGVTGSDGLAKATLTNTVTGIAQVTATLNNGVNAQVETTFVSPVDAKNSAFSASPEFIVADSTDVSTLTFIAKDSNGNAITGLRDVAFEVTGGNGTISSVAEEQGKPGYYTATLSGSNPNTATVVPKVAGSVIDGQTADVLLGILTRIDVNQHTFDTVSGFPTTGFAGADFQMEINGYVSNNNKYTWSVDQPSWVTVDNTGTVRFTGKPTSETKNVTITVTSQSGGRMIYAFSVGSWFVQPPGTVTRVDADAVCANQGNYSVPSYTRMTNAEVGSLGTRAVGKLWTEWGSMGNYGWTGTTVWASEAFTPTVSYTVVLGGGTLSSQYNSNLINLACYEAI